MRHTRNLNTYSGFIWTKPSLISGRVIPSLRMKVISGKNKASLWRWYIFPVLYLAYQILLPWPINVWEDTWNGRKFGTASWVFIPSFHCAVYLGYTQKIHASVFSFVKWRLVLSQSSEVTPKQWLACTRDTLNSSLQRIIYFSITIGIQYHISFRCTTQWTDIQRTYEVITSINLVPVWHCT